MTARWNENGKSAHSFSLEMISRVPKRQDMKQMHDKSNSPKTPMSCIVERKRELIKPVKITLTTRFGASYGRRIALCIEQFA